MGFGATDFSGNATIIPVEETLEATARDTFSWILTHPIVVTGCDFVYSEATDAAIATKAVVTLDHLPSGGSRVEKASYTSEVSKPVGSTGKLLTTATTFTPFQVAIGDEIFFELQTAQTATEAGKGYFVLYYDMLPDGEI